MAGIRNSILTRVRIAFLGVIVVAAAIVVKMVDIQFVNGDKWRKIAEESGLQFRKVKATRGNILSDDGSLLATSIPFYKLAIDPTVAEDSVFNQGIDSLSILLANFFREKSAAEYKRTISEARSNKRQYKIISGKLIKHQDKKIISTWPIFREGRIDGGVIFEKTEKRFRPFEDLARRTIGFLHQDDEGQKTGRGLEITYNAELAGIDGQALYQRISGGRWKPLNDDDPLQSENGLDLQTTINIEYQEFCNNVLLQTLKENQANYGCLILMEVETGEIKAMVNLGRSGTGEYLEDFNYAVQGKVEPGSTFKVASMMALLEEAESSISLFDSISTGDGSYEFYEDCIMRDSSPYGYGKLSVQQAFEKSSNIGISKLIFRYFQDNPDQFIKYLDRFRLTEPLNFQMAGEGKPFIGRPGDPNWSGCSLPWMSIGYELQLSPLQMLTFINGVANKGKMIEPIILKKILEGHKPTKEFESKTLNKQLCSDRTLQLIQKMMEGVVERGTAKNIYTDEYRIAGKTGTTQKVINGKYTKNYYTSFVGYFPADKPRYTCFVAIDEPGGSAHYGGDVCAPVFRKISDMVIARTMTQSLQYNARQPESLPYIQAGNYQDLALITEAFNLTQEAQNTKHWVRTRVSGDTIRWEDNYTGEGIMPDVKGMSLRDALYLLENKGLVVTANGKGRVKQQSIAPGVRIGKGNRVYLQLD
ncbi:penicillin-binding protein [Limibacter armeniacum]|uniref:penicillin-binding protein n=1 Tax=Limibacter armeniacum TaxID=466084 RepID=UPI002FE6591A